MGFFHARCLKVTQKCLILQKFSEVQNHATYVNFTLFEYRKLNYRVILGVKIEMGLFL